MSFQQRLAAFVKLGDFLRQIAVSDHPDFAKAYLANNWFTIENIRTAVGGWAEQLTANKLERWLAPYEIREKKPADIAIIMAGNIPLVGFHDLLCVLVSGNRAIVKMSDDDKVLPRLLIDELLRIEPSFAGKVVISEDRLPATFDAVIATGSNNTFRYFEYYFRNKPSLLRKNRTSVAVLTGKETPEELNGLGDDIFIYFGLGCRNVSKLYVPADYDLGIFFEAIEPYNKLLLHHKYANNYHYHKAIFLMNLAPHLDNNFIVVKEDKSLHSPLGTLFYERYDTLRELDASLLEAKDQIQCVVTKMNLEGAIRFGQAQFPDLRDYADGVDTMRFVISQ